MSNSTEYIASSPILRVSEDRTESINCSPDDLSERTLATDRRVGDPRPFPYPTGWYRVALSSELAIKQVKPLHYFGRDFVLFRTEQGSAALLDAYCPHLGAHLGHGGVVVGDSVRCPFHGWRFNEKGVCTEAPSANKIPAQACVQSWPIVERSGVIFVFFDALGRAPHFEAPDVSWLGSWAKTTFSLKTNATIEEAKENMVDVAHVPWTHQSEILKVVKFEPNGPTLNLTHRTTTNFMGFVRETEVNIEAIGPGINVIRFDAIVTFVIFSLPTPVDDKTVELKFLICVKPLIIPFANHLVKHLIAGRVRREALQDAPIWKHKVYVKQPMLTSVDGPIMKYRRWMRQFYPTGQDAAE